MCIKSDYCELIPHSHLLVFYYTSQNYINILKTLKNFRLREERWTMIKEVNLKQVEITHTNTYNKKSHVIKHTFLGPKRFLVVRMEENGRQY